MPGFKGKKFKKGDVGVITAQEARDDGRFHTNWKYRMHMLRQWFRQAGREGQRQRKYGPHRGKLYWYKPAYGHNIDPYHFYEADPKAQHLENAYIKKQKERFLRLKKIAALKRKLYKRAQAAKTIAGKLGKSKWLKKIRSKHKERKFPQLSDRSRYNSDHKFVRKLKPRTASNRRTLYQRPPIVSMDTSEPMDLTQDAENFYEFTQPAENFYDLTQDAENFNEFTQPAENFGPVPTYGANKRLRPRMDGSDWSRPYKKVKPSALRNHAKRKGDMAGLIDYMKYNSKNRRAREAREEEDFFSFTPHSELDPNMPYYNVRGRVRDAMRNAPEGITPSQHRFDYDHEEMMNVNERDALRPSRDGRYIYNSAAPDTWNKKQRVGIARHVLKHKLDADATGVEDLVASYLGKGPEPIEGRSLQHPISLVDTPEIIDLTGDDDDDI